MSNRIGFKAMGIWMMEKDREKDEETPAKRGRETYPLSQSERAETLALFGIRLSPPWEGPGPTSPASPSPAHHQPDPRQLHIVTSATGSGL